jgi:uncharacterized iron-regulated membrane protein
MSAVRSQVVAIHRGLGLLAALGLFLLGATGAVIVFHTELEAALHVASGTGPSRPIDEIVAAAVARHPGAFVRYLDVPDAPGQVLRANLAEPVDSPGALPQRVEVAVDPVIAVVQATRKRGAPELSRAHLIPFIYTLHYSLHLGHVATWALGLVAFAWLLDHAIALWLAFPSLRRCRASFTIRRGATGDRRIFDLHRAGGLWLFPITLTLAATGVYFNWTEATVTEIDAVAPITERYDRSVAPRREPLQAPAIDLAGAVEIASAHASGAAEDGLSYNPQTALYWASVFDPRDMDEGGRRRVRDGRDRRAALATRAAGTCKCGHPHRRACAPTDG